MTTEQHNCFGDMTRLLHTTAQQECWDDELCNDELCSTVDDFCGGNVDDAYYGGKHSGEVAFARQLVSSLDSLEYNATQIGAVVELVERLAHHQTFDERGVRHRLPASSLHSAGCSDGQIRLARELTQMLKLPSTTPQTTNND